MSRLIESLRLKDGKFARLLLHQQRLERSMDSLFPNASPWNLEAEFSKHSFPEMGLHKVRVLFDDKKFTVGCEPYTIRPVVTLKLVEDDSIVYNDKLEDRSELDTLTHKKGNCDDILIVRNKQITDTSYANVVFSTGTKWVTPTSYLLAGTMRQFLLENGLASEEEIMVKDIPKFRSFKLINALLDWESPELDVSNIR